MNDKSRLCSLTTLQLHTLDTACKPITRAFTTFGTYLVGSTMRGEPFRDVDVRTILDDDEWDALFADRPGLWEAFCLAWSSHLSTVTGLPIDYQVQQQSTANTHTGPRNPLGLHEHRPFAGLGDATTYTHGMSVRAQVGTDLVRTILEALAIRDGHSIESDADPGHPARNYELALRLGIGNVFGLTA